MTLTITFNWLESDLPHMIVCHCHGVTDREIRACVESGARTCGDVSAECGAGTGCGGCVELVAELVHVERRSLIVVRESAASPRSCLAALGASSPALQSA